MTSTKNVTLCDIIMTTISKYIQKTQRQMRHQTSLRQGLRPVRRQRQMCIRDRYVNRPAPTPEAFVAFLDTPARIIIEVVPQKTITFDGGVMRDTTSEALK